MTTVQTWTARRRQTFGDYGSAPRACWDSWAQGREVWAEHCKRCRECREAARVMARRDGGRSA